MMRCDACGQARDWWYIGLSLFHLPGWCSFCDGEPKGECVFEPSGVGATLIATRERDGGPRASSLPKTQQHKDDLWCVFVCMWRALLCLLRSAVAF